MNSAIRPIFQQGERLTAQRLNEAVTYLRTYLQRILLAPLSPGVAVGLDLAANGDGTVRVNPGVAVDGLGRLLVVSDPLMFGISDVKNQVAGVAARVDLAMDDGSVSLDPCAPQLPLRVVENVKLVFRSPSPPPAGDLQDTPSVTVFPWGDLGLGGRTSDDLSVPLGEVDANLLPTMFARTGIMPHMDGIRNTLGDLSILLGQKDGKPEVLFDVPAGGPAVQAAVVAANLWAPPAGRASPLAPFVFEAAGGRGASAGVSGVLAVSMEYDTTANQAFPNVPHSGFPLALSSTATTDPKVVPYTGDNPALLLGVSAGPSYLDAAGPTLVPVVTSGLVQAWVDPQYALAVGTELTPVLTAGQLDYLQPVSSGSGQPVVARSAVLRPSSGQSPKVLVWAAPPYIPAFGLAQLVNNLTTQVNALKGQVTTLTSAAQNTPKALVMSFFLDGAPGSANANTSPTFPISVNGNVLAFIAMTNVYVHTNHQPDQNYWFAGADIVEVDGNPISPIAPAVADLQFKGATDGNSLSPSPLGPGTWQGSVDKTITFRLQVRGEISVMATAIVIPQ